MTEKGSKRKLRMKERKVYLDSDQEDDFESSRTFDLTEKLNSNKYTMDYVQYRNGYSVDLQHFQKDGFNYPILVKEKSGLGIKVPEEGFTVNDVKHHVGGRRILDVMDVDTQEATEMSMKEWANYYQNKPRDRLLNVISLEFSHTRLDNFVVQPKVVRQLDWVETVWPSHLKECQTDSTNTIENMKYPKVQKYCLMSVEGCFTDFHIDMGGTSVWYHILHGAKIFWLIPPTEKNLQLYERWTMSGRQGDVFFADQVDGCQRIFLDQGFTFFIPTGWIHAVYTPKDSLVFGGNFLHSFNIPMQLRIAEIEEKTKVPAKFRYPFFTEIHWYMLEKYVSTLIGKKFVEERNEEHKNSVQETGDLPMPLLSPEFKVEIDSFSETEENNTASSSGGEKKKFPRKNRNIFDDLQKPPDKSQTNSTSDLVSPLGEEHNYVGNTNGAMSSQGDEEKTLTEKHTQDQSDNFEESPEHSRKQSKEKPKVSQEESVKENESVTHLNKRKSSSTDSGSKSNSEEESPPNLERVKILQTVTVKLEDFNRPLSKVDMYKADTLDLCDESSRKDSSKTWINLTRYELFGLKAATKWLERLAPHKKGIPPDIRNPDNLIMNAKVMIIDHALDDHDAACTGEPVIKPINDTVSTKMKSSAKVCAPSRFSIKKPAKPRISSTSKHRRVRCSICTACKSDNCRKCLYCLDMIKYGGKGTLKKTCIARKCLKPTLPGSVSCEYCGCSMLDRSSAQDSLMECSLCGSISHPSCLRKKFPSYAENGIINEELNNSWKCLKCVRQGSKLNAENDNQSKENRPFSLKVESVDDSMLSDTCVSSSKVLRKRKSALQDSEADSDLEPSTPSRKVYLGSESETSVGTPGSGTRTTSRGRETFEAHKT